MSIRVLIVDDSALMRQLLSELLSTDPGIVVVGTAADPFQARERIKALNPDVITLDVEMPRMDGLAFLRKIMALRPMPVVMVSSLTQQGADITLEALDAGAVDVVAKPVSDLARGIKAQTDEIRAKVKSAASARVRAKATNRPAGPAAPVVFRSTETIVLVGASTGGVEAIRIIVERLPANGPAMLITQHMPPNFTASFARRLNDLAAPAVLEAGDGDRILPGHVYIAPGGMHLEMARNGANYVCRLTTAPPVNGHKPSVDVLFESAARWAGANAVGVILTGMGRDGARGMLAMRQAGAATLAQDEASCVVYGMPRAAVEAGAAAEEVPLDRIAGRLGDLCSSGATAAIRV